MISYKNVTIARGENVLVQNMDLTVGEGEFVYLIGKVGAGKSSLLRTMYKDLDIQEGEEARIFDEYDLLTLKSSQIPYLRRKVGIIFQDFQLLTDRNVEDNLDFVLRATGWKDNAARQKRITEVLELVDMVGCEKRMPNTLSGGEQQRIVIARALLNSPRLILADEPTGNLDPETGQKIVSLLYKICKEQHSTVIMSTHNLMFLNYFPGRVIHLTDNQLVEVGGTEDPDTIEDVIAESTPDSLESLEGIPSDLLHGSDDSNNAEDHC
jgi:cell division transport system ATP-binding protein